MHPCLQVYDILECICSHLQASDSLDALAKLACTCTAFLDPALNALWHTIPTLAPLIKCLPLDAWTTKRTSYHFMIVSLPLFHQSFTRLRVGFKTLTRKTTREDWERCNFYAQRIRQFGSIELDTSPPGKIKGSTPTDKTVYMALKPSYEDYDKENIPPLLILPKLRSCRLVPHTSAPAPHWNTFLAHTLRSLQLRIPEYDPEETISRIVRSIGQRSPFLQSLRIDGISPTSCSTTAYAGGGRVEERNGLNDSLMIMLLNLGHLESLVCPHIQFPDEGVRYLARGMKIGVLHIKNTAADILEALEYGNQEEVCFEFLRELSVECGPGRGLEECIRLLERVANVSRIESLEVGRQGPAPTECELRNFIQRLSDLITTNSTSFPIRRISASNRTSAVLKILRVHQEYTHFSRAAVDYTTTLKTLSPLLAFPSLEVINIGLDIPFSFGDRDAERMSKVWPKLGELRLGFPGNGWGTGLNMTLDGLKHFARHCKELRALGVCLNLDPKREMDGKKENGVVGEELIQCCSLQVLEVGDSVFYDEPERVAKCLLEIFPGLRSVFGPDVIISPEWQKKWACVSLSIRELSL